MDPAKLQALRNKIKEIQAKNDNTQICDSHDDASVQMKEKLGIYKISRHYPHPAYTYLASSSGESFSRYPGYEKSTEFGKCFFRKKIIIDRIGLISLHDCPEILSKICILNNEKEEKKIVLKECLFLDLETTNNESGAGNCAYIIGLGYFDESCFVVEQYFMRDFDEEAAMIASLNEYCAHYTTLLSYNGKAFDVNVLQSRSAINRIPLQIDKLYHIDLLQLFRKLYGRSGKKLNLVNLEKELLTVERINDIPSQLVPEVYYQYLQRGYSELLEFVFEHNVQDIASLAGLTLLLENALKCPADYNELAGYIFFAQGQLHQKNKLIDDAKRFYELAMKADLEPKIFAKLCVELSRIYIDKQDFTGASDLWMKLVTSYPEILKTREFKRLAIHFEHYDKDFAKAFYFASKGSQEMNNRIDFEKRVTRIFKKLLGNISK